MKVLQVVDSLDAGGAERHVVDLAVALRRRGHTVHVACSVGGPLVGELRSAGIVVHALMPALVKRRACPEFAARLRGVVRLGPFDLVHAHIHAAEVAAAAATADTGAALVLTEHTEAPWRGALDQLTIDAGFRRAAAVLAVSPAVARKLRHGDGVPQTLVHVVPPAITPARVPALRPDHWRHRLVTGRVCRLQPEKGVDVFLRAAALVRRSAPQAHFVVVGDGPLAGPLRTLADDLGLGGAVEFLGHRTDARALLGAFDVMALTSRSEGSPLVVSEALAAGVPVVGSAVGGVPDQVRDGVEGLLVPPDRPGELAAALLRLLDQPHLRVRLGRAGRRRARAWPHERMVDEIEGIYASALGGAWVTEVGLEVVG